MTSVTLTNENESSLKCMEVWGGNGSRKNHFVRPGLDVWIHSQAVSSSAAGGSDLYLLSSCSSGRITRMMVADVCSQGSHFAELAEEIRELMKRNINTIRQTRVVREISRRLVESSRHGCIATALIGTYFAPTRKLVLCNTGNPPPLLYRAAHQEWSVLKQVPQNTTAIHKSFMVSDFEEYQYFETQLDFGDMLLSIGNALTECRSKDGRIIGMHGLEERVRHLDPRRPGELVAALTEELKQEHRDNLSIDDATVLLWQVTKTSVPWRDNLLAPLRYFQGANDNTNIE
ncbi:PP2C family protein-serine/threonine phosphatase [Bythopirellula goksoeyrii]|uniref:Stage II sporulation protein E (SpoIIE) n=1 Tax=Bythopirellula goksoeyrii TaxID=1400387 RepID=A0A5B9QJ83_9BACT|nr:PP2C family protein-serine/threonine phosphatase [Bythopirellula goksoeyrii]QEG37595.1 Stage II sporulation protein E (SpoIIE) [Bythopirellula goksoeyrii]